MKTFLALSILLNICSCLPSAAPPKSIPHPPQTSPTLQQAQKIQTPPPTKPKSTARPKPSPHKNPLKAQTSQKNNITFTSLTFDRQDYRLKVLDQKNGPGTQFKSAQAAGQGHLASINGGFFTPEGKPLGIVITNGQTRGAFNSSSFLGTGILDGENLTLSSRKSYKNSNELLQSGPRLLWQGEKLTGLSDKNKRPRSFLIWDGQNHFGIVHANGATLKQLSNTLKQQPIPNFQINYALNLDGGRSCDFWISPKVSGGGITKKSFLNKPVRNYLILQKR